MAPILLKFPDTACPAFVNQFSFLSNFHECDCGNGFNNSESLYMSMKCPDRADEFKGLTGGQAKRLGSKVKLREGWDEVRIDCMRKALEAKFTRNPELLYRLKMISGTIEERNTWGDTFWGVCNGIGENHLGKLLMELRDNL